MPKSFLIARQVVGILCLVPFFAFLIVGMASSPVSAPTFAPDYVHLALAVWYIASLAVAVIMTARWRIRWYPNLIGLMAWVVLAQFIWSRLGSMPLSFGSVNDAFSLWAFWVWPIASLLDLIVWLLWDPWGWQGFSGGEYQA